jgi:hypothetical protein
MQIKHYHVISMHALHLYMHATSSQSKYKNSQNLRAAACYAKEHQSNSPSTIHHRIIKDLTYYVSFDTITLVRKLL